MRIEYPIEFTKGKENKQMATVAERVDKGIRLLDENAPGWRKSINLDALHLGSLENCVLAQVYGTFGNGLTTLDIHGDPARDCGFDWYPRSHDEHTSDDTVISLENEWRRRLQ